MGQRVLDAVDVGGTWTVTGSAGTAPQPRPKPAAPTTSSRIAERTSAQRPNVVTPAPPSMSAVPQPRSKPAWRAGSGRWLIAALIVAGVAVPLAIGAGTFAYRIANAPVQRVGAAPVRYLAAANSTRIEAAAVSRGLRCATPPQTVGGTAQVRICQRAPGLGAASGVGVGSVAIVGNDSRHLLAVSAAISVGPANEPTDLALLQAIIDATVARRDAAADDAWLSAHFDQSGSSQTVANGVSLRLTVRDSFRSLVIVPAY